MNQINNGNLIFMTDRRFAINKLEFWKFSLQYHMGFYFKT